MATDRSGVVSDPDQAPSYHGSIKELEGSNRPAEDAGAPWSVRLRALRVEGGEGALDLLPELVKELDGQRVLLVTDEGILRAGHVDRALDVLHRGCEGLETYVFSGVEENPTESNVAAGASCATGFAPDVLIGLGGGSAMDCTKGINFIFTNGGRMQDYWGFGKATRPMLPSLAVPCTTGTGSEAQSFALISSDDDHVKMACGDPKVRFRSVILDSEMACTQPDEVFALTALDAVSHAVETFVTKSRNPISRQFSVAAWNLLSSRIPQVIARSGARSSGVWMDMLTGAHLAGSAIETSMLGAAHALANPISATCELAHGAAVAIMLPSVVRWNAEADPQLYDGLMAQAGGGEATESAESLASQIEAWREQLGVPGDLQSVGIGEDQISQLATLAMEQWTGKHNPRPLTLEHVRQLYYSALGTTSSFQAVR